MDSSCRFSWCGPRANNPVLIVREWSCGAANAAKQSTLELRVVCICHIRQSLEMSASKTAPVLHPQSIINSQGRTDWEVRRRESGERREREREKEKAKYHNGGFTFCFASLLHIENTTKKARWWEERCLGKKKIYKCQSRGWRENSGLGETEQPL